MHPVALVFVVVLVVQLLQLAYLAHHAHALHIGPRRVRYAAKLLLVALAAVTAACLAARILEVLPWFVF